MDREGRSILMVMGGSIRPAAETGARAWPRRVQAEFLRRVSEPTKLVLPFLMLFVSSCGRNEKISDIPPSAREPATMAQIANFKFAIEQFEADCGRFPSTAEGLNALVMRPADIPEVRWHQYLERIPKDAWGRDFVYRCPGSHNTNGFDLFSYGRDGPSKAGGESGIHLKNWY